MWEYTDKVMEYFLAPKNAGEVENPDAQGEVGSLACGDALKLTLKIDENERIVDAKFRTFGCASAIASSSVLTEMIIGKTLDEAAAVTNRDIADALGGLPDEKMHCSVMGQEALEAAIKNYRENGHPNAAPQAALKPEGKIVCHCFGVTDVTIRKAIRENNLSSLEDITHFTKAGGGCGQCSSEIEEILKDELAKRADNQGELTRVETKVEVETAKVEEKVEAAADVKKPLTNMQRMKLVTQVLEEVVSPRLKADGGDVELIDIDRTTVTVKLQGVCSACPVSDFTLKDFIERVLQDKVDPEITVIEAKE